MRFRFPLLWQNIVKILWGKCQESIHLKVPVFLFYLLLHFLITVAKLLLPTQL